MKKLTIITIALAFVVCIAASSFAGTVVTTPVTASVNNSLAIEFGPTPDYATNGSGLTFTVDAADYTNGWAPTDEAVSGKSDVGVRLFDNSGNTWYFKMHVTDTAGDLGGTVGLYRFIDGATNRNLGAAANGTVVDNAVWSLMPTSSTTVYTSGANDTINSPLGTEIGITFSLQDLTALSSSTSYSSTITYTITETP